MKGLILSGGKGTRLYPLTYTRAKQLIPIANKPVLFRVIEALCEAGIDQIGIVVGNTAIEIEEAVGCGDRWGIEITYILQDKPLGLAHAVKVSQEFLDNERFVMFLGDNVIEGGINSLIKDFATSDWNSQIVLSPVEEPQHFGVVELDDSGHIVRLVEKPEEPPSNLALVGIYMFDKSIFKAVDSIQPSKRGELEITDAIQWLVENGFNVSPHIHRGWWVDTGKPTDMLNANSRVLEELEPRIDGVIDEISDVDHRVTVESGAKIINSLVRGPTIIGKGTQIINSYIGPFTSIDHNVIVENSELERCIVLDNCQILDIDVRIQDSLIGRNTVVERSKRKPKSLKLTLGDHSKITLV